MCWLLLSILPKTAYADACPAGGEHDFSARIVRPATEDADGEREFTCVKCGYAYRDVIPLTGHHRGPWVVEVEPTCTTEGYRYRACTHYEGDTHYEEEAIPALSATGEHTWTEVAREDATCEEAGSVIYTCSVCGEQRTEVLEPLGHEWGDWQVVRDAGAHASGIERRICNRDPSHVEERGIAPAVSAELAGYRGDGAGYMKEDAMRTAGSGSMRFRPNKLDAALAGLDLFALVSFAVLSAPLISQCRWILSRRREARSRYLDSLRGDGRLLDERFPKA